MSSPKITKPGRLRVKARRNPDPSHLGIN